MEQKDIIKNLDAEPEILIVDDDKKFCEVMAAILSKQDYKSESCYSASEAISYAEKKHFHLALIDYKLGDMHGIDLAQKLKSLNPFTGTILITGHANLDAAIESIRKGIDYFIKKPVDPEKLILGISQVLTKQKLVMERKKLIDELKESNEKFKNIEDIKLNFINMISHELNTPLTAIRANIAYVKDMLEINSAEKNEEKIKKAVYALDMESGHLSGMIKNLLDITRIEAGEFNIRKKEAEINDVLNEALAKVRPLINEKEINLVKNIELPSRKVKIDPEKIYRVIEIFIKDACRYSSRGETVKINAFYSADSFVFELRTDKVLNEPKELFGMFNTPEEINISRYRGLGLSFAIAREIIEQHGGKIGVENKEKQSVFYFKIPAMSQ
ncbi:MAG: response regulator [Elusimicrobiota bacterium]